MMKNIILILAILVSVFSNACTKTSAKGKKMKNKRPSATNRSIISAETNEEKPETDNAELEITAMYKNMDEAVKAQDSKTIMAMENMSFWVLNRNGKFKSKADSDDQTRRFWESFDEISAAETLIQKIETVKEMKTAPDKTEPVNGVYAATVIRTFAGKTSSAIGKTVMVEGANKVSDFWVKPVNGGWQLILTIEISSKLKADGKLLFGEDDE